MNKILEIIEKNKDKPDTQLNSKTILKEIIEEDFVDKLKDSDYFIENTDA